MNLANIDLNLLVAFDVLLREKNVSRAAAQLNMTQPAMSSNLKRLRQLLNDPVLVRTSEGMQPTEKARKLAPKLRKILLDLTDALQKVDSFNPTASHRLFRIMASDYAASALLPSLLHRLNEQAPGITLDIMTPSDVDFVDVENGKIDMAINHFEKLPQSFHQKVLWQDSFSCITHSDNHLANPLTLKNYLQAQHVWVSKTGFGVGVGMNPKDVQKLGWVDEALAKIGKKRNIKLFTRNYQVAMQLAHDDHLLATLPSKATTIHTSQASYRVQPPPFAIPDIELKMIWSPLIHHEPSHIWLRQQVIEAARLV
ncbi:LysR family transcriptional regulator [Thalassotalea mangrovi]|uniref:LysR family transcriptional regulator n=1 Tax=Thalassotalea mangrovi TaxID=2572245 RepID=A0A4U1B4L0_9GAMM|nr:LysR family transcriptional regulator [Thalassotalea mangrovi]TKB45149.1 LysR family transcriptional regulator [Thalassotalea mangrovi]